MDYLPTILQTLAALGLINVWILRYRKETAYRGGAAKSLPEEFDAYGLPAWSLKVVGGLKIAIALALLIGIWVPAVVTPAAGVLILLMITALVMHLKVKDPIRKSLPAATMLLLAVLIAAL